MCNSLQCPLCLSKNYILIDRVDPETIIRLYKKNLNLDCRYLIGNSYLEYVQCENCKLLFFSAAHAGDEQFYLTLQENDWYYLEDKNEYAYASKFIAPKDIVLDVGCGKGEFSEYVVNKEAKFIGLEFSSNAKELAREKNIDISTISIQDYSENNANSVDMVTSFQVLEHVSNPRSFIESKVKTLKTGGLMIIAVPSEDSFLSKVTNGVLNMPPHHLTRWSDYTLRFIAKEFNLSLENIYHERVQPIHHNFYWNTKIQSLLTKDKLVDISYKRKVVSKVTSGVLKSIGKFLPKSEKSGHTVIAVYRKL